LNFLPVIWMLSALGDKRYVTLACAPPKPDLKTFLAGSIGYIKVVEQAVALQARGMPRPEVRRPAVHYTSYVK
jgi:hypothetical protein